VTPPESRILHAALSLPDTYAAPRTPTEQQLADIWCTALHMDCIGVNDNYFDLGGDSIMAAVIFSIILDKFAIAMPFVSLINAQTIAKLALEIDREKRERE